MAQSPPTSASASSVAQCTGVATPADTIVVPMSALAKKVPKPQQKKAGSTVKASRAQFQYDAFVNIINHLSRQPDLIRDTEAFVVRAHKELLAQQRCGDDAVMEVKTLDNYDPNMLACWLHKFTGISLEVLGKASASDSSVVPHMVRAVVNVSAGLKLGDGCANPKILDRALDKRAHQAGDRRALLCHPVMVLDQDRGSGLGWRHLWPDLRGWFRVGRHPQANRRLGARGEGVHGHQGVDLALELG